MSVCVKRLFSVLLMTVVCITAVAKKGVGDYIPKDYVWTSQSQNSSGSMPCGGHDIGMNVWVEQGDVLLYIAQSGWFDENNSLLKAGRWRLHFDNKPFEGNDFRQTLRLDEGCVYIKGGGTEVRIWADVFQPMVFVTVASKRGGRAVLSYESWRYQDRPLTKAECQQCSYKWVLPADCTTFADSIRAKDSFLEVAHVNREKTVFDFTVDREHLNNIKKDLYNPLGGRRMRVVMNAPGFSLASTSNGQYASTDYRAWNYVTNKRNCEISISLDNGERMADANQPSANRQPLSSSVSEKRSSIWWHNYWQRSWIQTDGTHAEAARIVRNYELFRYMLGCNAYGLWPTKFNGGLFTFDPVYVDEKSPFTPDYRKWGGGTMTAQNQRLVYWPMLKSGDTDMMVAQFDTYLRLLPTATARTRYYWGHEGALFTEQLENFGLPNPAEYGKHPEGSDLGVERNAWLEYEWDTALEFCMMMMQAGMVEKYEPLIEQCLRFFDEHYQYMARKSGAKALDGDGKLVIYPGSGCETYKMAYNPSNTIAALKAVLKELASRRKERGSKDTNERDILKMATRIPDIPLRVIAGDTCIAPAIVWARIQNVETPQLYAVFPWRIYGLGREHLDIARNTYWKDPHALEMRSSKGWKQDNIWAACLGLTEEARRLTVEKLSDGPYRFPAFWDAGFDWAPDCNRGGSGMIGLQEMLLQETSDGKLLLFPAWPKEWKVRFRLYGSDGRMVEGEN